MKKNLKSQVSSASPVGASDLAAKVRSANRWRDQYNPLRGLTITKAVSLLEAGIRGEYADLQWTYKFIEETDPDLFALVERRISALCEMDFNIKIVDEDSVGFNKTLANNQAEELHTVYDRIDNLVESWEHFEIASFRGFAHVQPRLDDSGAVVHLECLDQWNFVRDGLYGQWAWNPTSRAINFRSAATDDIILPQDKVIVRTVGRSIDRIGLIKYVRANMSEKDWDAYIEIYGIPPCFIIGPANVPTGKENEYRDSALAAQQGGGGYLPNGSSVVFATEARGNQPFDLRLKNLSEKLILVGTGGKLTMLTDSGSGTLAGGAHYESFKTIARSEAQKISQLFQREIDRPILQEKFPGKPVLAYFEIAGKEEQSIDKIVAQIQTLSLAGLQVDPEEASEKTGYTLTLKPQAPAPSFPPAFNREDAAHSAAATKASSDSVVSTIATRVDERLVKSATEALAKATAADLAPVRNRIEAALALQDDQAMLTALAAIPGDLPAMLLQICRDPSSARVLEDSMTAALFNGIAEGAAEHGAERKAQSAKEEGNQA